jgi:hypothetical protein
MRRFQAEDDVPAIALAQAAALEMARRASQPNSANPLSSCGSVAGSGTGETSQ